MVSSNIMSINKGKFGVVSHVLPPSPSGQAMVLYRLLGGLSGDSYCLISSGKKTAGEDFKATEVLDAALFYLGKCRQFPPVPWSFLAAVFTLINSIWVIFWRSREIARIARREGCQALIGCTGDFYDLPATYLASKKCGIAFIPYIFDDYAYQWLGFRRRIAKYLEPILLKNAATVIVPNEFLQKEYIDRHGVDSVVIHNPCPMPDIEELDKRARVFPKGINIVYTGAIYHAHYDAFANLVAALNQLGRDDVRLHLFTAQGEKELAEQGITGPFVVHHSHVPQTEVYGILRQADILFLPLAFNSPIPEVIRTSAPGKTGEYLAVGRPVLVHALPGSFISWYFRANNCGIVVDREDPDLLGAAVEEIISSTTARDYISAQAIERARRDFDVYAVRSQFAAVIAANKGVPAA